MKSVANCLATDSGDYHGVDTERSYCAVTVALNASNRQTQCDRVHKDEALFSFSSTGSDAVHQPSVLVADGKHVVDGNATQLGDGPRDRDGKAGMRILQLPVRNLQRQTPGFLFQQSYAEETRELPGERGNARNNARCTQARKTTDGQHQDVDRTLRGRVNQNDRRQR